MLQNKGHILFASFCRILHKFALNTIFHSVDHVDDNVYACNKILSIDRISLLGDLT